MEQTYKVKNTIADNHIDTIKKLRNELSEERKFRIDIESANLKREREEDERKTQKEKNEYEQKSRKQSSEYEKKSIKRKDKSEKTKFSLGMIASIATLAVGLFTLFKRA